MMEKFEIFSNPNFSASNALYLDSRYEALQKYEKVKEAEQTRLREEQERLREEQEDDNDNSDDEMNDSKTKTSKTPEASDYTTF